MGFLEALRNVLSADPSETTDPLKFEPRRVGDESGADAGLAGSHSSAGTYDLLQWRKKLQRILDELPASRPEWDALMYETRALELDPAWVAACELAEFHLMVRRAVSDRVVTEAEHQKLELARQLIGMSEAQAETTLHAIVADAESFFGKPVRDA